nr:MAG TPA: tail fiber protein [Caudoviricetes sp.]
MITKDKTTITYKGDGVTTSFPFPYQYRAGEDIKGYLLVNGKEMPITANYRFDEVENKFIYPVNGVPLFTTDTLVIKRQTPIEQNADLPDKYPYNAVETVADNLTLIAQEQEAKIKGIENIRNDLTETTERTAQMANRVLNAISKGYEVSQNVWAPFNSMDPAGKTVKEFKDEIEELRLTAQGMGAEDGTRLIVKARFDVENFIKNAQNESYVINAGPEIDLIVGVTRSTVVIKTKEKTYRLIDESVGYKAQEVMEAAVSSKGAAIDANITGTAKTVSIEPVTNVNEAVTPGRYAGEAIAINNETFQGYILDVLVLEDTIFQTLTTLDGRVFVRKGDEKPITTPWAEPYKKDVLVEGNAAQFGKAKIELTNSGSLSVKDITAPDKGGELALRSELNKVSDSISGHKAPVMTPLIDWEAMKQQNSNNDVRNINNTSAGIIGTSTNNPILLKESYKKYDKIWILIWGASGGQRKNIIYECWQLQALFAMKELFFLYQFRDNYWSLNTTLSTETKWVKKDGDGGIIEIYGIKYERT